MTSEPVDLANDVGRSQRRREMERIRTIAVVIAALALMVIATFTTLDYADQSEAQYAEDAAWHLCIHRYVNSAILQDRDAGTVLLQLDFCDAMYPGANDRADEVRAE